MFRLMVFDAGKAGSKKIINLLLVCFNLFYYIAHKLINSLYNIHHPLTLISYEKTFRIPKKLLRSLYGCR